MQALYIKLNYLNKTLLMKKISLFIFAVFVFISSYAQNTYPWAVTGNVGIGTTSPLSILNVASASGGQITFSNLTPTSIGIENQSLVFNGTNNANGGGILELFRIKVTSTNGGVARGVVNFFQNGNSSPSLSFLSNGNLGIGTPNPISILNVASVSGDQFTLSNITPTTLGTENQSLVFNGTNNANGAGIFELFRIKVTSTNGGAALGMVNLFQNGNTTPSLSFLPNTNVGIGTATLDAKLAVNGAIHSQSVKVDLTGWSDYVFEPDYKLLALQDVKNYIDQHHHLPEIPSEKEIITNGLDVGEISRIQMKKIEELTLYLIEKDNKEKNQDEQINTLKEQVKQLKDQMNKVLSSLNK